MTTPQYQEIGTECKGPDLFRRALDYARRGWSIIATIGKKSASFWEPFQTKPADEKTLRRLFGKKGITGLAVIMGKVSGGLACLDFDDPVGYHKWAKGHADLATTLPTAQTSRGFHVYFRGPEGFQRLADGEYRADSGHYCLLPPSRHPDGPLYRWIVPLPDGDLPEVDPVGAGLVPNLGEYHPATHPYSLHVSDGTVQGAILATLPTRAGERNRRLFDLARHLLTIMPAASLSELEPIVRSWHGHALPIIRTKEWLPTWVEFQIAWAKKKRPIGPRMKDIVAKARARTPADADEICQLRQLCRALQDYHGAGNSWPLSCRQAGKEMGVSHDTAAQMLKLLCTEGFIEPVKEAGPRGSRIAREYRLKDSEEGNS
ncbi:MAG TPA: bifunctional DNA primase/polymerase [Gemmataceae bacterium]|nr:bifunctional DNA primase/polymerase [Gemmataceae bacterium]